MTIERLPTAELERLASLAAPARAGGWIDVHAPFTGERIGRIPRAMPEDARTASGRAKRAQANWASWSVEARARVIVRFHDLVLEHRERLADLVQLETGKARLDAFEEIVDVVNVARYYAYRAPDLLATHRRRGFIPGRTIVRELRHPVGLVTFIVPWNYPLNLAITDAIPALLAGNTAVLKPDHHTSLTALAVASLLYEAGLPHDAFIVVTGYGPELGSTLIECADFVMFTGSTRTGKVIAEQASRRLIGFSLELGGKNPMLVLRDARIGQAVAGAVRGAFVGAGQVCVSIERLFVDRAIHGEFVKQLVAHTKSLTLGAAFDFSVQVGSLGFAEQLERVERHVADARAKGARILAGGRARPDLGPYFYEPTIIEGAKPGMLVHDEETFGPVLCVYPYDSVDEAIEEANDTPYGLNASIFTRDEREAFRLAACLHTGTVNINEGYGATWGSVDAPIGGMKSSGVGRRHGREGLLKYTEAQTIAAQRFPGLSPPPRVGSHRFARWVARMMGVVRRVPLLR